MYDPSTSTVSRSGKPLQLQSTTTALVCLDSSPREQPCEWPPPANLQTTREIQERLAPAPVTGPAEQVLWTVRVDSDCDHGKGTDQLQDAAFCSSSDVGSEQSLKVVAEPEKAEMKVPKGSSPPGSLQASLDAAQTKFMKSSWTYKFCAMILAMHPWTTVVEFSPYVSHTARMLLAISEIVGASATNALFFQATGGVLSRASDPTCNPPTGDWGLELANQLAVATVSVCCADFVIAMLAMLLHWDPTHEDKKELLPIELVEREILASSKRSLFWVLVPTYIILCVLVDLTFLANVSAADTKKWLTATAICLFEDFIVVPLALGFVLATLAALITRCRQRRQQEADDTQKDEEEKDC
eukprot:TRINITY_DN15196_c0_g1_i4.p1 TRINITY_DN15196_c0_g1~~TRINITY_DN15196_c0_g1_i4.p1  ORF type:complete len:356 (+),score=73.86 TRINITY_DN15196_c0_g1_i4:157-1224(+)